MKTMTNITSIKKQMAVRREAALDQMIADVKTGNATAEELEALMLKSHEEHKRQRALHYG